MSLRRLVPGSLRRMAQPLVLGMLERRVMSALRGRQPDPSPGPLVVSGLLNEAKGISEGARLSLAAFRAAGFSPVAHDLRPVFDRTSLTFPAASPGGVWFIHVNAPEAIAALGRLPAGSWLTRYRIGYWAYELPRAPADWMRASRAFHEIWTPSQFTADAMTQAGIAAPVRVMPHPVALGPPAETPAREAFGIPAVDFAVLAMGDLRSSPARKNILGAIAIYRQAFPDPGAARLLVKLRDESAAPGFLAEARRAADDRADVVFITGDLPARDVRRLLASVDVVLSPHRAEGFGLPLAEAFMAGVPALATGWSGNLAFMKGLDPLLIPFRTVAVDDPSGVYRAPGQVWADPDIAQGAAQLAALAASPALRRQLAAAGRTAVEALSRAWSRSALDALPMGRLCVGDAAGQLDASDASR